MTQSPNDLHAQHFNLRFRGFDVAEVNAFLEAIAKDFLKLRQDNKKLNDQLQALEKNHRDLNDQVADLLKTKAGYLEKEQVWQKAKLRLENDLDRITAEKNLLGATVQDLEKDNEEYRRQEKTLRNAVLSAQKIADEIAAKSRQEADELLAKTREHVGELEKSADEMKARSRMQADKLLANAHEKIRKLQEGAQELTARSRQEADELLAKTRKEAKKIREETDEELYGILEEIEALKGVKAKVRLELQDFFQKYLQQLQDGPAGSTAEDAARTSPASAGRGVPASEGPPEQDDLSDLFQKIDLTAGQGPGLLDKATTEPESRSGPEPTDSDRPQPAAPGSMQQESGDERRRQAESSIPGPVRRFAIHFGRALGKSEAAEFNEREETGKEKKMP